MVAPYPIVGVQSDVQVSDKQMDTFKLVDHFLSPLGIGLHCSRCQGDLRAYNHDRDEVFSVKCNCREFRARNRNVRRTSVS